ncbi:MAG: diguanylate cyclase [Pseudomonadota bacterium]
MTVAVAGTTLAFDLSAPMGVAAGMPYVAAVLIAIWLDWTLAPLVLATAGTALTIVGYFFAPEMANNLALIFNRAWAIFVIWATAIVLYLRNQAEQNARETARDKDLILNSAVDGIIGVDAAGLIGLANDAAAHMLGWRIRDLIGQPLCRVTHWTDDNSSDPRIQASPIYQAINKQAAFAADDQTFHRKDGTTMPVTLSIKLRKKMKGEPGGAVLVFQDRTEHERRDEQLRQLATQDALTGLRNRRYFFSAAGYEFDRWVRTDEPLSLLMIDVDRFKELNDEFGHEGGDEILKTAARILRHHTRRIDIVSRMGNGEFAILLPATRLAGARALAERIRSRCENFKLPYGSHSRAEVAGVESCPEGR